MGSIACPENVALFEERTSKSFWILVDIKIPDLVAKFDMCIKTRISLTLHRRPYRGTLCRAK
jgi:hypothetical protein